MQSTKTIIMTSFSKKQLLLESSSLVKQKKYKEAFDIFKGLSLDLFIDYILFNNPGKNSKTLGLTGPLNNKEAARFFWQEYLPNDLDFVDSLLTHDCVHELFKNYFKQNQPSKKLLDFLAKKHPHKLIELIRLNEAFLSSVHYQSFSFMEKHQEPYLKKHYQVFTLLKTAIENLEKDLLSHSTIIKEADFWNLFVKLTFYLEKKVFLSETFELIEIGAGCIVQMLKWNLHLSENGPKPISEDGFVVLQLAELEKVKQNEEQYFNCPLIKAFDKTLDYHYTKANIVQSYCYNLNIEPIETVYKSLELDFTNYQEEYTFRINGLIYNYIWLEYRLLGEKELIELIYQGEFTVRGVSEIDKEINYQMSIEKFACLIMMDEMRIGKIPIPENIAIDKNELFTFIFPFSFWAKARRNVLLKTNYLNWYEYLINTVAFYLHNGVPVMPIRADNKDTLFQLAKDSGTKQISYENIIPLFSIKLEKGNKKVFSPTEKLEDVFQKPVLEINNLYFSMTAILEYYHPTTALYRFFTETYHDNRTVTIKQENTELEQNLALRIKKLGIEKVIYSCEFGKTDTEESTQGDIDIAFEHKGQLYLIEIKRTKYRLNPKERWLEKNNVINKAAKQLNKTETFIKENPSFLKEKLGTLNIFTPGVSIKKFICTSSPEYRGEIVDGCEVISLQEFLLALFYIETSVSSATEKTEQFISFFKFGFFSLQLTQEELEIKRIPLFCPDEATAKEFMSSFNKGIEHSNKQENALAIKYLKDCLDIDPEDSTVLGALANVYADMGNYQEALIYFNKGLEITPGDYLLLTNKAMMYIELGKPLEYFKIMVNVMKMYKTGIFYLQELFSQMIQERKLTEPEIREISLLLT